MTDTERLWAIEAIRALKARYFHGVDTKDAALLRSVFTDDAITDFRSESPDGGNALLPPDPDAFVRNTLAVLAGTITVPSGSLPALKITSADAAPARRPMTDPHRDT